MNSAKKPMTVMLIVLGIVFGGIAGYKLLGKIMMTRFFASQGNPVITVSAAKATTLEWSPLLVAVGNIRAVQGVNVTTSLAGMVKHIYFTPGATVAAGDLLLELDADAELGQLRALEANAGLAKVTYQRDKMQYAIKAVSKAVLETDEANLKNLDAQVSQQKAIAEKKSIRAPFAGKLGISLINLGQYINPGDVIVNLQTEDPVYVDFYIPQQSIPKLAVGQTITLTTDVFPGKIFSGRLTTINPALDVATRNIQAEAVIANTEHLLKSGMFVSVKVTTGKPKRMLTLPQSAISFNSYGDIVYSIKEDKKEEKDSKGRPILSVEQSFVETGEKRGDQIIVLKGIHEGDRVVTSGQLKLKNGSRVSINNTVQPSMNASPHALDEHGG